MVDPKQQESFDELTGRVKSAATKKKGRGFGSHKRSSNNASSTHTNNADNSMLIDAEEERERKTGFETFVGDAVQGSYQRSVEGWIVFISGIHEEAQEDTLVDKFSEYGQVLNIHLNLDRRTGFVKGYCLIEYAKFEEAKAAIDSMNGKLLYDKPIHCDFAFLRSVSSHTGTQHHQREKSPSRTHEK